ncbi:MAG: hypothetical protein WD969_16245 [Paracoccaceae bacterium]
MLYRPVAAAALAAALLSGCIEPTPYQHATPDEARAEGFADVEIEPGRWRVTFSGNSATSREMVETALLYRAAEITLANGADWFRIVDDETEAEVRQVAVVSGFRPYPYGYFGSRGYGRYGIGGFGGIGAFNTVDAREIRSYQAIAEIILLRGTKPAEEPAAYDARGVISSIGPTLKRPEAG